jgi:hypothetical protein
MVYINKREETWHLCRYPLCSVCSNSLKAFIFHVDCFRLAKGRLSKLPIPSIWLLGLFVSPSARLYHPHRLRRDFAHLATHTYPAADLSGIIEGLRRLPNELCEMVVRECPESPLWRYSVVNAFSSHYIYCSQALIEGVHRGEYITAESSQTSCSTLSLDPCSMNLLRIFNRKRRREVVPDIPARRKSRSTTDTSLTLHQNLESINLNSYRSYSKRSTVVLDCFYILIM